MQKEDKEIISVEAEVDDSVITIPFDPKKVDVGVDQITIEQLVSRIEHNEIDLMPEFQRQGNLWDNAKMSKLIESILIKLPLPAFYFDVADDDKWIVVDGLQRLSALKKFMVDKSLKLKDLEFLKLDGKKFNELERSFQRRIKETNVTVFKIKKGTPRKVLTSLFHRINTGGMSLTSQEIRHALNQGCVTDFLNKIANSDWFKNVLNVSPKRMLDKELIVRFMSFYRNGYKNYVPSLQQFLDEEMEFLNNKANDDELINFEESFKLSLNLSINIFGTRVFSKALIDNKKRILINRSLFETTSVNLAYLNETERGVLLVNKKEFVVSYKDLMRNTIFDNSITANTGHWENVEQRHKLMQELITKFTGHAY